MSEETRPEEISIAEIFLILLRRWRIVGGLAFAGALIAFIAAHLQARTYRGEITVSVVTEQSSTGLRGALSSSLAGLAPLAGLDLASGDAARQEQLAYLRSHSLIREFITRRNLLPVIFASQWDEQSKRWKSSGLRRVPTVEDGVGSFYRHIRTVTEDRKTGLVTIRVEWTSRQLAADWANGLVELANDNARSIAASDARKSMAYLDSELEKSSVLDIRQAIFRMIEAQLNRIMVASVRPQYAFKVLEPAVVPDLHRFVYPQPLLQTAIGLLAGGILGSLLVLATPGLRRPARQAP